MSYNSKYTGAEVEALLDKLAIDKEDFFIWSWNGNVYGNLLEGEYDKIKNTTLVLINALGTEAQYMIPVARNIDGDNIVLTIHVSDSEGLVNLTFTFTKEGTWQLVTYEQSFITEEQLNSKQDEITDLDTIRAGAAAGATALQSVPSEYVTESELTNKGYATTSALNGKQDKLTSGTNIKTINGQSLLGSGNITIDGGSGGVSQEAFDSLVNTVDNIDADVAQLTKDVQEKQDKLVSGTNIKTINGQSLLGGGDITIEGGGGGANYPEEWLTIMEEEVTLQPNVYYHIDIMVITSLDINLESPTNYEIVNEYIFQINKGYNTQDMTISFPSGIIWKDGNVPTLKNDKVLVVSIVNNLAVYAEF